MNQFIKLNIEMVRNWEQIACNCFSALNFVYGCISWTASVEWGRNVLFRKGVMSAKTLRPIEYYAVAVGLLCFHAALLSRIIRDSNQRKIRLLHALTQLSYWVFSGAIGIYFAATEVYRPEAGVAHSLVALAMSGLAVMYRKYILDDCKKHECDTTSATFTLVGEPDSRVKT